MIPLRRPAVGATLAQRLARHTEALRAGAADAAEARRVWRGARAVLACAHCNSNAKRDQYPCSETGECLLIDPSCEDPYDHLRLILRTGEYRPVTPKGAETIKVFGLQRPALQRGRAAAFVRCRVMVIHAAQQSAIGQDKEAQEVEDALCVQPFADVLYSMVRVMHLPGAAAVLGSEVVEALHRGATQVSSSVAAFPGQRTEPSPTSTSAD